MFIGPQMGAVGRQSVQRHALPSGLVQVESIVHAAVRSAGQAPTGFRGVQNDASGGVTCQ
jgi:hypothetical protein